MIQLKKKHFKAPFYGWGSTASRLEPLRGGSLLFTTYFPDTPATNRTFNRFIFFYLSMMLKAWYCISVGASELNI